MTTGKPSAKPIGSVAVFVMAVALIAAATAGSDAAAQSEIGSLATPRELAGLREAPEIPLPPPWILELPDHRLGGAPVREEPLPGQEGPLPGQGQRPPPAGGGDACDKDVDLTSAIEGVVAVATQDNGICTNADIDTYVRGDKTYVVQAGFNELIFTHTDVTDPANPVILSQWRWIKRASGTITPDVKAFRQGDNDYIAMGLQRTKITHPCGVLIWDVTDPANAAIESQFIGSDWCDVHNVFVEKDPVTGDGLYLYATANNTQDLRVLDISQSGSVTSPVELGKYQRTDRGFGATVYDDIYVHDVTVVGGTVYASYWFAGLDVFPAGLIMDPGATVDEFKVDEFNNDLVVNITPAPFAEDTPFLVHHAFPSADGSFVFLEDEITFDKDANGNALTNVEPVQMFTDDGIYVDGLVLNDSTGDVPVNPAHNLEISYDFDPNRLYVGWYKLGLQAFDFNTDCPVDLVNCGFTGTGIWHQAQTEATDGAYDGAWGVRLAEITTDADTVYEETNLYIFQSDRRYGLIVDCVGASVADGGTCPESSGSGGTVVSTSGGTGSIKGKVSDQTGSNLGGALVATNTGQETTTSNGGRYGLDDVPEADHEVTASKSGCEPATQTVTVVAGGTAKLSFELFCYN